MTCRETSLDSMNSDAIPCDYCKAAEVRSRVAMMYLPCNSCILLQLLDASCIDFDEDMTVQP
jgi:hypothetical protein